jgi:hypothetical protein
VSKLGENELKDIITFSNATGAGVVTRKGAIDVL